VVVDGVNGGIGLVNSGIYAIHKVFTNPTAIPNEIKSETGALVSETGKYFEGQYNYATRTSVKQQLVDTYEGFKNPESYEAPLEFAMGLLFTKSFKFKNPKINPSTGSPFLSGKEFYNLSESGTINPKRIRFSQNDISRNFRNNKGPVEDLVEGLKNGSIDPATIKPIRIVERNGKIFTLDNRRLKAFQDAGIDIPFKKLDKVPESELYKFSTENDGVSIQFKDK